MSPGALTVRERIETAGPAALSDAELVELVLSGAPGRAAGDVARDLVRDGLQPLSRRGRRDLLRVDGVGTASAARLSAVLELSRRLAEAEAPERIRVSRPGDLAPSLQARYAHERVEVFGVVLLDGRNRVTERRELSRGGWSASVVRPREVFREALLSASPAVLLFHNHPSGDPTPSREDISITQQLAEAGELLGVRVLDHLIVAAEGFVSLRERGVL